MSKTPAPADDFATAAREWTQLLRAPEALALALGRSRALLKLAVALALAQEPDADTAANVADASPQDAQLLASVALAVARLLRVIIRERLLLHAAETSDAHAQLLALLPRDFHSAFLQTLRENWDALDAAARASKLSLPRLTDVRWCVAPPSVVVLRLQTSDGAGTRTVRVPARQFHQLRYSAAKVLQEMRQVEAHPIMRLTRTDDGLATYASPAAP